MSGKVLLGGGACRCLHKASGIVAIAGTVEQTEYSAAWTYLVQFSHLSFGDGGTL